MKNKIIIPVLSAALAVLLTAGCSKEADRELPEDNPANHGYSPIMETENGYYSNYKNAFKDAMCLRFYERGTDKQIFLCAKPECQHDGGSMCVATQEMDCINTVLYDGFIYVLAVKEIDDTVSYDLYKAALDGSSLTKVGTAFSVNNSSDEEYERSGENFIIHKGYAYIPYHLTFGASQFGFAGSGLVKMNIADGSTETLLSGENYFSAWPQELQGSGDQVYYIADGVNRYNITSGEIEKLPDINWYSSVGKEKYYAAETFGKDGKLVTEIYAYDKESNEKTVLRSDEVSGIFNFAPQLLPYEDKLIIGSDGNIYVYSESGELLAEADDFYEKDGQWENTSLKISEDKLYFIVPVEVEDGTSLYDDVYDSEVYSCPIDDLIAGNGERSLEYKVKNFWSIEAEFGRRVFD